MVTKRLRLNTDWFKYVPKKAGNELVGGQIVALG